MNPHFDNTWVNAEDDDDDFDDVEDDFGDDDFEDDDFEDDDDVQPKSFKGPGQASNQMKPGQGILTPEQVREIRQYLSENWPLASIAKVIGTSPRTVARIRDGETYTYVK